MGELESGHSGGESRTADDGGGEWALGESESARGRAPRDSGDGTLEEHCPGRWWDMGEKGVGLETSRGVSRSEVGARFEWSATARQASSDWLDDQEDADWLNGLVIARDAGKNKSAETDRFG